MTKDQWIDLWAKCEIELMLINWELKAWRRDLDAKVPACSNG